MPSFRAPDLIDLNLVTLSSQNVVTDLSWGDEKPNDDNEDEFGDFN